MNSKALWLAVAGWMSILSVCVFADVESYRPYEQSEVGQVNPALTDIGKLYVVIIAADGGTSGEGLSFEGLEAEVTQRLADSGLKAATASKKDNKMRRSIEIPELRVRIYTLKLANSDEYVFRVETSLARKVYLKGRRTIALKANVWKMGTTIGREKTGDMSARVTGLVFKQVDAFTAAWRATNSKSAASERAGKDVSAKADEQADSDLQRLAVEYKYAASKNSKVFHKGDCSVVNSIKQANIVGYKNAGQAKLAGKRPCKRCKP